MPRETRKVFIKHQNRTLGRRVNDRVYIREWNRKSAVEKDAWLNEFEHLTNHYSERERLQPALDQAWDEYRRVSGQRPLQGRDFGKAHRRVEPLLNELRQLYTDFGAMHQTFHILETAQPMRSAEAIRWSTDQMQTCTAWINELNNRFARLNRERNGPETAADQNNQRRMPAQWYPWNQLDLLNRRDPTTGVGPDLASGTVGLLQPGGHTWLPWLGSSGGMATGHLWLQFENTTQRVMDVSLVV